MRFTLVAFVSLLLVACSRLPPGPSPVVSSAAREISLSAKVIEESGACIQGATLTVVAGQDLGRSQTQQPCNAWSNENGFYLTGLTSGGQMTVRASAAGYVSKDVVAVPSTSVVEILLTKMK